MITPPAPHLERMLRLLSRPDGLAAADLLAGMDVSRATLSRTVEAAGNEVVRIGAARNTRYARRRQIRGQSQWPVYRIDAAGQVHEQGTLGALHGGAFVFEPRREWPAVSTAPFQEGLFPDLPWFLDDLRPQGFLGRTFAHRCLGLTVMSGIAYPHAQ